jgi:uncharacterized protein (DUF1919 family)
LSILKKIRLYRAHLRQLFLSNKEFSIISDNCWGGFVYQYLNLDFKSPFIGLFVFSSDYIRLIKDLRSYLNYPLEFIDPKESIYREQMEKYGTFNTYPIALLGDVEIHFLHYDNETVAREKWERRVKRIDYNNLIVKFCDRDLATNEHIDEFLKLDFERKICLTSSRYSPKGCITLREFILDNEWHNFRKSVGVIKTINKLYSKKNVSCE